MSPNEGLLKIREALSISHQSEFLDAINAIMGGADQLYSFMHRSDKRCCECMKYVAAAGEIGILRNKASKVKTLVEHCGFCNEVLARPQVCALCKKTAYCSVHHQKNIGRSTGRNVKVAKSRQHSSNH